MHTRRAEDNVLVECVEIVLAEHKIHTEGREGRVAVAELGRFLFVMYGHAHAGGRSMRMSGILLTPAPMTPTRLSERPPRYCSNAVINA